MEGARQFPPAYPPGAVMKAMGFVQRSMKRTAICVAKGLLVRTLNSDRKARIPTRA